MGQHVGESISSLNFRFSPGCALAAQITAIATSMFTVGMHCNRS